jgi:hypothetical protein
MSPHGPSDDGYESEEFVLEVVVHTRSAAGGELMSAAGPFLLCFGPAADLVDQGNSETTVERLGVEQILVAQREGVLSQGDQSVGVDRGLSVPLRGQADPLVGHGSNDLVRDVLVAGELAGRSGIAMGLAEEGPRGFDKVIRR